MKERKHACYPYVELPEQEFGRLLDLVDALDPQQLLRLSCKVDAAIRDQQEPMRYGGDVSEKAGDTVPPPAVKDPSISPESYSIPPALCATPEEAGVYVHLDLDWDTEEKTRPGV